MMAVKRGQKRIALFAIAVTCLALSAVLAAVGVGFKYDRLEKEAQKRDSLHRINSFYYNHLTYKQQQLYDAMLNGLLAGKESTDLLPYSYSGEDFALAVSYLRADHPELFYVDYAAFRLQSGERSACVALAYAYDAETTAKMQNELIGAIRTLCADIEADPANEFDVEHRLHDRFVHFCSYVRDEERLFEHGTVYGALVLGTADSYGYAGAMKLLLAEFGIYSFPVFGHAGMSDHVWNMVYVDGKFYHLDALWNDADLDFARDIVFHGYFNLSTEAILEDHTLRDADILPEAVDDGNYYITRGLYVHNTIELDRIAYREILGAGYTGAEFVELYPAFDTATDEFRSCILGVIARINGIQQDFTLKEIYRVYSAAEGSDAITIQLYYDKKIESAGTLPEEDQPDDDSEQ